MIEKRHQKPLGFSDDLPEGIFGLLKAVPPSERVLTPSKVRKAKMAAKSLLLKAEQKSLVQMKAAARAKRESQKPEVDHGKVMPDFNINYDKTMPAEAKGLALDNVVSIPEDMLKSITENTKLTAKQLSSLMLLTSATSVLSFDAASSYVRTVLDDGLGIEVDVDRGVLEVVKNLSRLDVIFFYVRRLKMPQAFKKKFMHTLTEESAKTALLSMQKLDTSNKMSQQIKELEGVIMKRSEQRSRVARSGGGLGDTQADVDAQVAEYALNRANKVSGTVRSRKESSVNSPAGR